MSLAAPQGVTLGPVSERIFGVLSAHTAFPWPILQTQCQRLKLQPDQLRREQLEELIPLLVFGVGRFTTPAKADQVKRELEAIAHGRS